MYLLAFIPSGLLVALLGLLVRRRVYATLPCFFAYVAFAVAADLARFLVHNHPGAYYATYWVTEAGYDLLGILVMYEVLRAVLASLPRARWVRLIFPAILIASLALSLARAHAAPPQFGRRL